MHGGKHIWELYAKQAALKRYIDVAVFIQHDILHFQTHQIWVQIKLKLEQCTSILSNYSKYVKILLNSKYIEYIKSNYIICLKDVSHLKNKSKCYKTYYKTWCENYTKKASICTVRSTLLSRQILYTNEFSGSLFTKSDLS